MLLLTTTSDLIQIITGAAVSTDIVTSYVDITTTGVTPGSFQANTTTATTTTIVASPAASTQRQVKMISVRNNSTTTAQTVTIQKSSTTAYNITGAITLNAGETLYYQDMYGFSVRDINGQIKQTINTTSASLTSTYVGYGNSSGVLTGSSTLTYNSAGNLVVGTPSSGTALTVNGFAGSYATTINGANASTGNGLSVVGNYTGSGTTALVSFSDSNNTAGVNLVMTGNGSTTPNKYIRVINGQFQIVNSTYATQIFTLTDAGALTIPSTMAASSFSGAGTGLTGTASSLTAGAVTTTSSSANTFFNVPVINGTSVLYGGNFTYNPSTNSLSVSNSSTASQHSLLSSIQQLPANTATGGWTLNAYLTVGGSGGNVLSFGQNYLSTGTPTGGQYSQWIQSGFPYNGTTTAYYNIILNPLGGSVYLGPNANVANNGTITHNTSNTTVPATATTGAQIIIANSSTSGQSMMDFQGSSGSMLGRIRSDYVGNLNYVCNGGAHEFWIGGDSTSGSVKMTVNTNGTVTINNLASGSLTSASGVITSSSDERLKRDIVPFTRGIEAIVSINPISYKWTDDSGLNDDKLYSGFSAQDVQKSIPEAVNEGPNGYLGFADRPVIAALVNAVKEQQQQIEELKALVATLMTK